jgi:hypothetical protein
LVASCSHSAFRLPSVTAHRTDGGGGWRTRTWLGGALLVLGSLAAVTASGVESPASATTVQYELYCPNTQVGNVVINNVMTSGNITPPHPAAGQPFTVTSYQTVLPIPETLAQAMAVLGNTAIVGTATTAIDASGATPAALSSGAMSFDVPIPKSVPAAGVIVELPSQAATIGPFTSAGNVSIVQNTTVKLALSVSGNTLTMDCTAFPNDGLATGIASTPPSSKPISLLLGTIDNQLAITAASRLPDGIVGWHYSTTLGVTGGTPPYAWRVVTASGKVPKGLKLDSSTWVISGTPKKSGGATFTLKVLDH